MDRLQDFVIEGNTLEKYVGTQADVVIPDGVQVIGRRAFSGCKSLVSVTVPEGVRILEWGVFMGCESLKRVTLPSSVTQIGGGAFRSCKALSYVALPEFITRIEKDTFWGCKSLADVKIPDCVTEIGEKAFYGCKSLHAVTLPQGVRLIGEKAFGYNNDLRSYTVFSEETFLALWKSVEELYHVYILYSLLKEKKFFPAALRKIKRKKMFLMELAIRENDAECAATLLSLWKRIDLDQLELMIQKSEEAPAVKAFLLDYKRKAYSPKQLERIQRMKEEKELGLRPRSIADWKKIFACISCGDGLSISHYTSREKTVVIPEQIGKKKIVAIEPMAFFATPITSVVIPESIQFIGTGAFCRCAGLADENGFVIVRQVLYSYFGQENHVRIPDGVKTVSQYVFYENQQLISVTVPEGVEAIEEKTFYYDVNLEALYLPQSLRSMEISSVCGCEKLTIHAPAGSYAETYAKENNIPFVAE